MTRRIRAMLVGGAAICLLPASLPAQPLPPQPGPAGPNLLPQAAPDDDDDQSPPNGEVYTRGPLHEAFATPVANNPAQNPPVAKQPPEAVDEAPPDEKPDGNNVVWIPGYWAFDDQIDDFLWISGLWRDVPPGRRWVPGYWHQDPGGWRWVRGMWVTDETEQLAYLPQPPDSLEQGPSSPQPSDNHFWIPGNWDYQNLNYRWRPGYWSPFHENWIWVPAHYVATPGGFVFVPGYWDYQFVDRGVVFAPVRFAGPVVVPYRPVVVVSTWQNFFVHMFVGPRVGVYYFGDYYGPTFVTAGFTPWYSFHGGRRGYDPLFVYYRHVHGPDFTVRLQGWHDYYVKHPDYRPMATLRQQQRFVAAHRDDRFAAHSHLAAPMRTASREAPFKFARISNDQRVAYEAHAKQMASVSRERRSFERDTPKADPDRRPGAPNAAPPKTLTLPREARPHVPQGPNAGPGAKPDGTPGNDRDRRPASIPGRTPNVPGKTPPGAGTNDPAPGGRPDGKHPNERTPRTDIQKLVPTPPGQPATGSTQPGLTQRPNQPGTAQPGSTQPGAAQPGTTQPGATQPRPNRPGTTTPGVTQPRPGQPGATPGTTPGATQPGGPQPRPGQPGTTPGLPQPRPSIPRSTQPGATVPRPGQPGVLPGVPQPGATQPGATQPGRPGQPGTPPGFQPRPSQPGQPRPNQPGSRPPEKNPKNPTGGLFPDLQPDQPRAVPTRQFTPNVRPQQPAPAAANRQPMPSPQPGPQPGPQSPRVGPVAPPAAHAPPTRPRGPQPNRGKDRDKKSDK